LTNIIDIYFDSVGSTATAPSKLWQWSKGQVVRINGLDLPTVYQVHFSNNPTLGTAEPVAVSGNMVSIPDIYLTTGEPVYLFIWLSDETSAETVRKGTIYVAKRSQPSGEYDPTAEQQTIIDGLIGSINTAVDTAEGYANSAQTYSGNAATSATEALDAKDAAQGYAEQASQTAQGVEILVNRAEDAADDAETAKQDVEQLKQAVEGFADDAESAKMDAETARGEAQGFAQTASAKASEALQSASQASQSAATATAQAQTATAKASEASQSAETAATKASEASASATTATTKASEASTSASTATTAKNDAVTAKNAAITAKTGAETARNGAEAAAQSVSASAAQIATNTSDITDLKADLSHVLKLENTALRTPFVQGTVGSGGIFERNTKRICTKEYTDVSAFETIKYTVTTGYRLLIAFYSEPSESAFVSSKYWLTGSDVIGIEGSYMRVTYISAGDATPLTVEDADKVTLSFGYALETAVKQNSENIDDIQTVKPSKSSLKFTANKTIDSGGVVTISNGRISTVDFNDISDKTGIVYSVTSGYSILIAFYSEANESAFVSAKYWLTGSGTLPKQGDYFRVTYNSVGGANPLTVEDADKVTLLYNYELLDRVSQIDYSQKKIVNNLVSDGLYNIPDVKVIQNGTESDAYYGQNNVKYQIGLPDHNMLHVTFDYMYTQNVPQVSSGWVDIFGYSNVLKGTERLQTVGQFGILPQRVSAVCGRGTANNQINLSYSYMQRMGNPSFLVKYDGEYTSSNVVGMAITSGTLTFTKDSVTLATVNYSNTDTIQSLVDKIDTIADMHCDVIDSNGTCADLLFNNGVTINLIPEAIISFGWDKSWHTFEAVINRTDKTYVMSFDGITVSGAFAEPSVSYVVIGGDFYDVTTPIRLRNLAIDIDSFGDAEVINAPVSAAATANTIQLISGKNPRLLILEGHGIVVGSDVYAQTLTDEQGRMAVSTDRLDAVFTYAESQGYVPVKWSDVIAWKQGKTNLPKRCFTIMMDDYRVENYADYDKRRPFVKHGVDAGLAIVSDLHALTDVMTINGEQYTVAEMFKMIELAGWYPCSHTRNHRRNGDYTASQLIEEFKADILSCNKHGIYSDVLVYPYGSTGYNTTSAMVLSDFALGVDVDDGGNIYNCKGINTYKMLRTEIGTRVDLAKVLAPFV